MDEAAADYAGRMIDDGEVLDRFIEAHKEKRTLQEKVRDAIRAIVRKLTGVEKKQAQTAEGKLTAALEAATRQAETLQGESSDGTMGATRNSLKEDGRNERGKAGSGGLQKGSGREFGQTFNGERNKGTRSVRGELSAAAGRYGGVNPSFGQTPIRSWAEGHTVEPSEGSVAYAEQQTAVDYGCRVSLWLMRYGPRTRAVLRRLPPVGKSTSERPCRRRTGECLLRMKSLM